ncbi:hypothetical protein HBH56_017760 [Parastagonospora nodorum]|uniref:Uncharacterized protein n=1 Tax=Phaeosphaeria nodorum (strain SN15 / ATCC MYA-4574 / FGSC 10173) TaxID=321614 RepID=A0A7U2EYT2_PHANO|nr:hypothetical protein HBH56_017760 [Parastagonospora nodorum]QRC95212.1 hypothetical protein JI435_302070 [Parastagonospora nodorum SN15]KAH3937011.1 hypothetical protein HBH54_016730 [Parastagonospora nodorum]KAH3953558.1 hypothetical protein HBH53_028830 [Parastagonospora nodorum]KAH4137086.1 hypothetical protein HBH45_124070 [Parastagonospora nodorum]
MPVWASSSSLARNQSPVHILLSKNHIQLKSRSDHWVDDKIEGFTRSNRAQTTINRRKLDRMEQATGRWMIVRRK